MRLLFVVLASRLSGSATGECSKQEKHQRQAKADMDVSESCRSRAHQSSGVYHVRRQETVPILGCQLTRSGREGIPNAKAKAGDDGGDGIATRLQEQWIGRG